MRSGDGTWEREPGLLDQNQAEYATQVAKALSLQGSLPSHLDPRFQLGFTVDDFSGDEWLYLRRATPAQMGFSVAAVAAQRGYAQITGCPDKLTIFRKVTIANLSGVVQTVTIGFAAATAGSTPQGGVSRDDRIFVTAVGAVGGYGTAIGPVGPIGQKVTVPIGGNLEVEGPWISGGDGTLAFKVVSLIANAALDVSVLFTERNLGTAER